MDKLPLAGVALFGISLRAQDTPTEPAEAYKLASSGIAESGAKHRAWAAQWIAQFRFESLYTELLTRLSEFQPSESGKFNGSEMNLPWSRLPMPSSGPIYSLRRRIRASFTLNSLPLP